MSTTRCPFCAEEIQSQAKKCRYCNEWLTPPKDEEHSTPSNEQGLNKTQKEAVETDAISKASRSPVNHRDEEEYKEFQGDALYEEIKEFVLRHQEMSASLIQRKFEIGYPRAGRIVDQLERDGVLGPANGSKPRKVLWRANNVFDGNSKRKCPQCGATNMKRHHTPSNCTQCGYRLMPENDAAASQKRPDAPMVQTYPPDFANLSLANDVPPTQGLKKSRPVVVPSSAPPLSSTTANSAGHLNSQADVSAATVQSQSSGWETVLGGCGCVSLLIILLIWLLRAPVPDTDLARSPDSTATSRETTSQSTQTAEEEATKAFLGGCHNFDPPGVVVTQAEYNGLVTGMSYQQVARTVCAIGTQSTRSDVGGIVTEGYTWQNEDGSNMMVIFQNDGLVQKSQVGLR